MKYIRGTEIIETPKYVEIDGVQIELSDVQLRLMKYKPLDEVIMEQNETLSAMAPTVEEIKQRVMDSLTINIPGSGLPYMIGFSWQTVIVDNEIRFKMVRDENGLGTTNNPIIFAQYVILIPNACYLYEGDLYKYRGSKKSKAIDWESCKDDMELM